MCEDVSSSYYVFGRAVLYIYGLYYILNINTYFFLFIPVLTTARELARGRLASPRSTLRLNVVAVVKFNDLALASCALAVRLVSASRLLATRLHGACTALARRLWNGLHSRYKVIKFNESSLSLTVAPLHHAQKAEKKRNARALPALKRRRPGRPLA